MTMKITYVSNKNTLILIQVTHATFPVGDRVSLNFETSGKTQMLLVKNDIRVLTKKVLLDNEF